MEKGYTQPLACTLSDWCPIEMHTNSRRHLILCEKVADAPTGNAQKRCPTPARYKSKYEVYGCSIVSGLSERFSGWAQTSLLIFGANATAKLKAKKVMKDVLYTMFRPHISDTGPANRGPKASPATKSEIPKIVTSSDTPKSDCNCVSAPEAWHSYQ